MQVTNDVSLNNVNKQFEVIFKCPSGIAQGVPTANIRDEVLQEIKQGQREARLLNHNS